MMLRVVCMVLAGLLTVSCAKTPAINSTAERLPDLSAYSTYQWQQNEPQATINAVADDELDGIIRNVIAYHLERRGLQQATENPELLVAYRTNLRQPHSEMPLSRGKAEAQEAAPWAATSQEPEGSLSIDLIDSATQKRLWRGTATAVVRDAQEARGSVPEAVRTLLGE